MLDSALISEHQPWVAESDGFTGLVSQVSRVEVCRHSLKRSDAIVGFLIAGAQRVVVVLKTFIGNTIMYRKLLV